MDKTTYPFVDWTDFPKPDGSGRSRVIEDICIGEDCWHNRGALTQVPVFSSCFHPSRFSGAGPKVVGFLAENDNGEYTFSLVLENVGMGEIVRADIRLEGHYTDRSKMVLTRGGYCSNFAWVGPHVQRIVFPVGYGIASAEPAGGHIGRWHGYPAITWRRSGEFWGEVRVQFEG